MSLGRDYISQLTILNKDNIYVRIFNHAVKLCIFLLKKKQKTKKTNKQTKKQTNKTDIKLDVIMIHAVEMTSIN